MTPRRIAPALLLTTLLASGAALAQNAPAAPATAMEGCYGVALKGEPVCAAGAQQPCDGAATIDHPGDMWKPVPKGQCERTPSTTSPTRFGQLQPYAAGTPQPQEPAPAPAQ